MLSWRTLKRFGTAALAPAVLMFAAVPAFAAHGGGHGGGGHGGGFHGGGFHAGGYRGGYGGYRGYGLYRGGYGLGYGLGGYGLGYGLSGYGYGGYSYPSYYGSTYVNTPSYVDYSSYYPPVDTTGYVAPADYNVAPAAPDNEAHITLNVPANAEVWFDGDKTTQAGPTRQFVSPPLTPGQTYTYHVRARWVQNGKPVDQTRELHVQANQQTIENFPAGAPNRAPGGAAPMPPAAD
ncbi:MAG TPA: TIGR03000 domain-containing protein [Gemmataceae bacterium]|nr:TIGR03000 domain-containing protein [Gemmataceae bacterium]